MILWSQAENGERVVSLKDLLIPVMPVTSGIRNEKHYSRKACDIIF
jgi:hypothetical protein